MTNLADRLRKGAEWVKANARYHFEEHQKHDPLRQSLEAAEAMIEAAEALNVTPPASERSKEEVVTIDGMRATICEALLDAFPMADKVADNYAAVAAKAVATNAHPRAALEPASLHKGEGHWSDDKTYEEAPAPLPVTITDEAVYAAMREADDCDRPLTYEEAAAIIAAALAKPGEQG